MALISSRTVRCPLCGRPRGDCTSQGHVIDGSEHRIIEIEEQDMADEPKKLGVYEVDQNGTTATLKLTEDDAKRMGAKRRSSAPPAGDEQPVAGKARTAPNK